MKILEKNVYSCDFCGNYRGIVKEKTNDIVHVYCLCDLNHLISIPSPSMISKDGVAFYWKPISEYKNENSVWVHVAHFAGPILENKNAKINKGTKKSKMIFIKHLFKIQKAIKFAIKTHEVYQKQKRKGKDVAYITHPLTVGLILAYAGAEDDVICAGILHDTIEDSIEEKKVTFDMLKERFGENVANLVLAVTETDKSLSWDERKELSKEHIKSFSKEAVLVKTADILANIREIIEDYEKEGDQIFVRFNASKEKLLKNYLETITILIDQWPKSPLAQELSHIASELARISATTFMSEMPAQIIDYKDYNENAILECPVCKWKGKPEGHIEYYADLFDVSCPICEKMLLIVNYPLVKKVKTSEETNEWASKLSPDQIEILSEEEILEYIVARPCHPGQYGFMLQPQYFKSEKELSEIMYALLMRMNKIEDLEEKMQS